MGNPFGFLEYARKDAPADAITARITNFNEFHTPLSEQEQKKQGERCMSVLSVGHGDQRHDLGLSAQQFNSRVE